MSSYDYHNGGSTSTTDYGPAANLAPSPSPSPSSSRTPTASGGQTGGLRSNGLGKVKKDTFIVVIPDDEQNGNENMLEDGDEAADTERDDDDDQSDYEEDEDKGARHPLLHGQDSSMKVSSTTSLPPYPLPQHLPSNGNPRPYPVASSSSYPPAVHYGSSSNRHNGHGNRVAPAVLGNGHSPQHQQHFVPAVTTTTRSTSSTTWPPSPPHEDDIEQGAAAGPSKRYPRELQKTLVAAVFTVFNFVLTCVSLAVVHEYRPLTPPLPDQILDRLSYQEWALFGSEYLLSMQTALAIAVIVFHRHRFIVLRRVLLIIGVLYMYRAVTMYVTSLPAADTNYVCAPKFGKSLTITELVKRVVMIMTGFGLSVNGHHVYCGDYIYSGHTMIVYLGHLITHEYTPRSFVFVHWLTWFNALTAIVLLLLSRGHYTIDVLIALFVVSRLWCIYHTMAGHVALRQSTSLNLLSRFWWFRGFCWFEANVKPGKLPNEYNWPCSPRNIANRLLRLIRRGHGHAHGHGSRR